MMPIVPAPAGGLLIDPDPRRGPRLALLGAWAVLALYLALHHVMWRDEVRAFSLALQGDGWVAMIRGVQGEGHPLLWYVALRAAHDLLWSRAVLPVLAFAIGAGAAALLALRSPFRPWVIALALASGFMAFEYVVSARNYGVSLLLLFAFADRYPAHRDRGVLLGVLLALLCSTNMVSIVLAGGLCMFWLVELVSEDGVRWTPRVTRLAINAGIAAAAVMVAVATVYPPYNDSAATEHPGGLTPGAVLQTLIDPRAFADLIPGALASVPGIVLVLGVLLAGLIVGVARRPGAMLAALLATLTMQAFFELVYPGSYRHQALLLGYLLALHWLVAKGRGGRWPVAVEARLGRLPQAGAAAFAVMLGFQLPATAQAIGDAVTGVPMTRARDLGAVLRRPELRDAIVIGHPDWMLEALPYYAPNPTYLVRQQAFSRVTRFSRHLPWAIDLGDYLTVARRLHAHTGRAIVIVMKAPVTPLGAPVTLSDGYAGTFRITPAQARDFLAATVPIADLTGGARTDESYAVYRLR